MEERKIEGLVYSFLNSAATGKNASGRKFYMSSVIRGLTRETQSNCAENELQSRRHKEIK
jgi:hypothetical protein